MPATNARIQPDPHRLTGALVPAAAAMVAVLAATSLVAAPEPDPVPTRWQLYVETSPLQLTTVEGPDGRQRPYFFMTYEVTNDSGQDVVFAPVFELADDEGRTVRAGRDVPGVVTQRLLQRLENPLLQDQIGILGLLLQGRDNAKEGLVVWPAEDLGVDRIDVFGVGFSGEIKSVMFPDPTAGEREVFFRKTLMLSYSTPGELIPGRVEPIKPFETRWVMR